ncbi:hypothetical protein G210_3302 [Candida maltosa Xu316]|uniref:Thiamine pyrophosphokinase n=1 Tax=Candida maltosa (strain Xu316) TaxID=1245528 RepID=M3JUA7_CANMX|nr:hypothetical protein G210_3302 [Candida maltosa Xu316]
MSRSEKLKEQVIEQPNTLKIEPPKSPHHHIQPFIHLSHTANPIKNNVLLILNQKITIDLISFFQKTDISICADGGANRLYEYFNNDEQLRAQYIPDYIVGDFDSLRPEVRSYYESKGSRVIHQAEQYSNDFMKCIYCIQLHYYLRDEDKTWPEDINEENGIAQLWESLPGDKHKEVKIYVLNAVGGRFDQSIQSINQLYILNESTPNLSLFFITASDVIFLLKRGKNYVTYDDRFLFSKSGFPSCGMLPLSNKPIILSSYGLKYDVREWTSKMMGYVSSSNSISGEDGFIVECSDDIVMNIEIDV